MAKGYTQTSKIDYIHSFSPVAKMSTVWVLLSLTTSNNWLLHQLDVNNAFLHGDLVEEVYIEAPLGCVAKPN